MKKFLSVCAVALISTAVYAATPAFHGSMVGGTVYGPNNETAIPDLVFNCDDPKYGHFDLCIDMTIMIDHNGEQTVMNAAVNPKFASQYPHVLMRFAMTRVAIPGDFSQMLTQVNTPDGSDYKSVQLDKNYQSFVTRTSNDGGQTWSKLALDFRPITAD